MKRLTLVYASTYQNHDQAKIKLHIYVAKKIFLAMSHEISIADQIMWQILVTAKANKTNNA